jgi:hypothetical protein
MSVGCVPDGLGLHSADTEDCLRVQLGAFEVASEKVSVQSRQYRPQHEYINGESERSATTY